MPRPLANDTAQVGLAERNQKIQTFAAGWFRLGARNSDELRRDHAV